MMRIALLHIYLSLHLQSTEKEYNILMQKGQQIILTPLMLFINTQIQSKYNKI